MSTRTVATEFAARDAGYTAVVGKISGAFEQAAHRSEGLRERMGHLRGEFGLTSVGILGVGVGLGAWIEKAREANKEFGSAQKSIAGVLSGSLEFSKGTTEIERYTKSLALAKNITNELDETSARFNMQFQDVQQSYKVTAAAAGKLGLTQEQVMELNLSALATAKRFGASGEEAANAIARAMIQGKVKGFDPFSLKLRELLGDMKKLDQASRFEHIEKALQGSMQIADAMSGGIGGALARIQNVVEDTFRDATGPLFKEIAKSLEKWAAHLRQAKQDGKPLIDAIADKLVAAFHALEKVSGFIKEHWVAIGAVFATLKAGDLARNLGGMLSGAGAAAGRFGGPLSGAGNILSTVGALAPALGGIVTAAGLAAIALKGMYDEWQSRKRQAADLSGFFDEMGKVTKTQQYLAKHEAGLTPDQIAAGKEYAAAHAKAAAEILKSKGLWENGRIEMERFNGVMNALSDDLKKPFTEKLGLKGLGDVSSSMLGAAAAEVLAKHMVANPEPTVVAGDDKRKFAKAPITNIYGGVHVTQKFEEADPDRVFLRFKADLEAGVARRTQSVEGEAESH